MEIHPAGERIAKQLSVAADPLAVLLGEGAGWGRRPFRLPADAQAGGHPPSRGVSECLRRSLNESGGVQITITENGIGIATANLARIFAHGYTTQNVALVSYGTFSASLKAEVPRFSRR